MTPGRRVVHVFGRTTPGDIEVWLPRLLKRLDLERFPTSIFAVNERPGELDDEHCKLGLQLVRCAIAAGWRTFLRWSAALLHEREAAVLHLRLFLLSGALAGLARSASMATRIAHAHSSRDAKPANLARRAFGTLMCRNVRKFCTHWVACSSEAGDFVFGSGWRDRDTAHGMPSGIDVDAFGTYEDRETLGGELGVPPECRSVGHVGNFRRARNHVFLIEVFREMLRRDPRLHLVLVGAGERLPDVRSQVEQIEIGDRVTFASVRKDVPHVMEVAFELLLLPSPCKGLAVAVVEAQCAGLPCVVFERIPPSVQIVDGQVEWESRDAGPERWAETALVLLERPPPPRLAAPEAIRDSTFSLDSNPGLLCRLCES